MSRDCLGGAWNEEQKSHTRELHETTRTLEQISGQALNIAMVLVESKDGERKARGKRRKKGEKEEERVQGERVGKERRGRKRQEKREEKERKRKRKGEEDRGERARRE